MHDAPRPRPVPCPAPPLPALVSWTERRAAQAAWMADVLDHGRPGIWVNDAEPSISKTGEALRLIAASPGKRFLYLAPSHALLEDVAARAIAAGVAPGDVFIARGLERLCDHPDVAGVRREVARGRSPRTMYCDARVGLCGREATCAWHTQREAGARARLLLAPSAYLALPGFLAARDWGNHRRDAVIVDEDPASHLAPRRMLPPEQVAAYRTALAALDGGSFGAELRALADFLVAFAADERPHATYRPATARDPRAWKAGGRRLRQLMRRFHLGTDAMDFTALFGDLLAGAFAAARPPGAIAFGKDAVGRPYVVRPIPALPDVPVIVLDGTAVQPYYEAAFRRHGAPSFFLPPPGDPARGLVRPAGRIMHVVDATTSRAHLRSPTYLRRVLASIRAFVVRRRAADLDRRFLLVTYMDQADMAFEGEFRKALGRFGVEVVHFGAVRGLDRFAGWDTIVVGGFRLRPEAYAEDARTVLGAGALEEGLEPALHRPPTAGPTSFVMPWARHRDPRLRVVFEQKTLAELVQAVARSRVLVPGREDVEVVVYADVPLPGLLVEPTTMAAFDRGNGLGSGASEAEDLVARARQLAAERRKKGPRQWSGALRGAQSGT